MFIFLPLVLFMGLGCLPDDPDCNVHADCDEGQLCRCGGDDSDSIEGDVDCTLSDDSDTGAPDALGGDCEDDPNYEAPPKVERTVTLNEIFPGGSKNTWLEFYNWGDEAVNIGEWRLGSDNDGGEPWYVSDLAAEQWVPAGGYLSFETDYQDTSSFGFALSPGSLLVVFSDAADGVETVFSSDDNPIPLDIEQGTSMGRVVDGSGDWVKNLTPTRDASNVQ